MRNGKTSSGITTEQIMEWKGKKMKQQTIKPVTTTPTPTFLTSSKVKKPVIKTPKSTKTPTKQSKPVKALADFETPKPSKPTKVLTDFDPTPTRNDLMREITQLKLKVSEEHGKLLSDYYVKSRTSTMVTQINKLILDEEEIVKKANVIGEVYEPKALSYLIMLKDVIEEKDVDLTDAKNKELRDYISQMILAGIKDAKTTNFSKTKEVANKIEKWFNHNSEDRLREIAELEKLEIESIGGTFNTYHDFISSIRNVITKLNVMNERYSKSPLIAKSTEQWKRLERILNDMQRLHGYNEAVYRGVLPDVQLLAVQIYDAIKSGNETEVQDATDEFVELFSNRLGIEDSPLNDDYDPNDIFNAGQNENDDTIPDNDGSQEIEPPPQPENDNDDERPGDDDAIEDVTFKMLDKVLKNGNFFIYF